MVPPIFLSQDSVMKGENAMIRIIIQLHKNEAAVQKPHKIYGFKIQKEYGQSAEIIGVKALSYRDAVACLPDVFDWCSYDIGFLSDNPRRT